MWVKKIATFACHDRQVTVGVIRGNGMDRIHPLIDIWRAAEAVAAEQGKPIKVVSPQVADYLLMKTDKAPAMARYSSFPVDGIIAYDRKGRKPNAEIVFTPGADSGSVIMAVPEKHRGKNRALAVCGMRSSDFRMEGRDVRIEVPAGRVIDIPAFPYEDGWYGFHTGAVIPFGNMVFGQEYTGNKGTEHLRYQVVGEGPYVGPPFRHVFGNGTGGMEEILTKVAVSARSMPGIVVELQGAEL